jgi:hypothetical protein
VAAVRTVESAEAGKAGDYYVQVGAFKDRETARRLAAVLREQNYPVEELAAAERAGRAAEVPAVTPRATTASGSDRYDVIVTGGSTGDINTRLAAKGLASEAMGDGVRILPSLSLQDAVALSKDLNSDGFRVQVRRGDSGRTVAAPAPAATAGGDTVYRVRVGGYPDRAAAQAVVQALESKGYTPFIARGRDSGR